MPSDYKILMLKTEGSWQGHKTYNRAGGEAYCADGALIWYQHDVRICKKLLEPQTYGVDPTLKGEVSSLCLFHQGLHMTHRLLLD